MKALDGFAKQLEAVMMMLRNCLPKLKRNTFKLGGNHLSFHPDCDFCKYTEEAGGVFKTVSKDDRIGAIKGSA
jgi:hypothetical protein